VSIYTHIYILNLLFFLIILSNPAHPCPPCRYSNLFKLSNVGLEGCVKVARTFYRNGTQRGGHCGNVGRYPEPAVSEGQEKPKQKRRFFAGPEAMGIMLLNRTTNLLSKCSADPDSYMKERLHEGYVNLKGLKARRHGQTDMAARPKTLLRQLV
jgi:hypothetical protein